MAPFRTPSFLLALALWALPADANSQLSAGDRAWDTRAEVLNQRRASHERIEQAIGLYRAACESEPDPLEARWKLLRALHYLIEFSNAPEQRKGEAVEETLFLTRTWTEALEPEDHAAARDRAQLYFWSAIAWGARGQRVGLLTIVREGVAGRMHDYVLRAVALDPEIERGGGYRLLSRLHAELPRVPFITGWVDRDQAVPMAERAFAVEPDDPGNRLILALALLERAPERRVEAAALLESVSRDAPRPAFRAEDLAIRAEARERLTSLGIRPAREHPT
jgi:tetratricopeptide (TPR) repeat protein